MRGTVLVWTALIMVVLVAFAGLACDTAYLNLTKTQLQTVADASALAGAQALRTAPISVTSQAQAIAALNRAAGKTMALDASDVVLGRFVQPPDPQAGFYAGQQPYNAVQVTARRTTGSPKGALPLVFGPAFGVVKSEVSRKATAMIPPSMSGILVLDPTGRGALTVTGNASVVISSGGSITVDSNHREAVVLTGNASVSASSLNIVGNYKANGSTSLPNPTHVNATGMTDPLAALAAPPQGGIGTHAGTDYFPGHFPSGIHLSGNGNYTFRPGIYYIDGGLSVSGSVSISGTEVLFYINSGALQLTGGGSVDLTPATTGTYAGLTFFQGRNDTSTSSITGNGDLSVEGTIYMPAAQLNLTGTGDAFGNALIVKRLSLTGTGSIQVPRGTAAGGGPPVLVQ